MTGWKWSLGWVAAWGFAVGQAQTAVWTVRPEWVRAHEEFLASDVMAGRGSATRDEEIAATYVASRFVAYGLTTAPGMTGYIQSADVVKPELDGKATLTRGDVALHEGQDFLVLEAAGNTILSVTGALAAAANVSKGDIALMEVPAGGSSVRALSAVRTLSVKGASAFVVPEDDSTQAYYARFGGRTHTVISLKSTVAVPARPILAVAPVALARLKSATGLVVLMLHPISAMEQRRTFNAVGYLPGREAGAGTILLTAHLDHLGVGKAVNGDSIYNGANDDAAGTTAVLELAHALAAGPRLRRSVLFVCYGSEEAGELGSTYFGAHSPVPLAELVANLEFEMIGTQDPKMPKGVLLFTGWERSNLGPTLKAHGALLGPDPYPEQHFFERSDNYALALKGVVAHTAAGWGTPPTYHQPSDDLQHLDFGFMTAAIQSLVEPVRWLAESEFKPEWMAGGQPKGR